MPKFHVRIQNQMFGYESDAIISVEAPSQEAALAKAQDLDTYATVSIVYEDFLIKISPEQACALYHALSHIGGSQDMSARQHTSAVMRILEAAEKDQKFTSEVGDKQLFTGSLFAQSL